MQNKGLITVFAILFGLVSLYQLSFTFIATNVEDEAKAYATSKFDASQPELRAEAENQYLDSIATQTQFLGIDYKTAKEKELNKGLDLKGGINVILQVSVKDILKGLANNTKDPAFNQALMNADELQKDSQSTYVESFFQAFEALPGENRLASPDIFFNKSLEGQIEFQGTGKKRKSKQYKKMTKRLKRARSFEEFYKTIQLVEEIAEKENLNEM